MTSKDTTHPGTRYRITVQGELDSKWADWAKRHIDGLVKLGFGNFAKIPTADFKG